MVWRRGWVSLCLTVIVVFVGGVTAFVLCGWRFEV